MKKIALMLALCLTFAALLGVNAFAAEGEGSGISPRFTNTAATQTSFYIDSDGEAMVGVGYFGYPHMISQATIKIKIEKRNLLVFWKEVCTDQIISYSEDYVNNLFYQMPGSGKYRLTVTYEIFGTSGAIDEITSELEDSY